MAGKLTKGQRDFFAAVACVERGCFHRRVIEPVERMGLVLFVGGFRLVGRNSFPADKFVLTEDGVSLADQMFERRVA
jgi:hypothetical protein